MKWRIIFIKMADKWLDNFVEIELQKADRREVKYILKELMKPTREGDYDSIEDGFNIY